MSEPAPRRLPLSGRVTLVVTNLTKLAGLVIGCYAGFSPNPKLVVIALAAFMMAGAQFGEDTVMNLISRVFGFNPTPPSAEKSHSDNGK